MSKQFRRVVTGHSAAGKSTFIIDAPTPHMFSRTKGSAIVHELWETGSTPADNRGSADAIARGHRLAPPKNGSVFRVIEYPPDSLKPKSAVERAEMRVWTKAVDENLHPACGEITFASCHRNIVRRLPEDKFQAFLNSTPPISVTAYWHERKKEIVMQGLDAPGIGDTFRLYDGYLGKMEKVLATRPWLAGETFSLADIAVTPYVNRLDMLGMAPMWESKRPRVTEWFNRIKARAAFKPSFLDWCPPDLTADLLTFGRQS
ncbi:MAG: glutathione S-transferase C-terminal domain-containing protein, partial [Xanthobacteraceae bacterium]